MTRQHGTTTMYQRGGCRCDLCRMATRDYQRKRRGSAVTGPAPVHNAIRERAIRRLIAAHRDEYDALLTEERDKGESA